MENRYCGACHGERGCPDCGKAARGCTYQSLTEFHAESDEARNGNGVDGLLLVADVGTTTLAFVCADTTGRVLAAYGQENPQRRVAADVCGRVDAACQGRGKELVDMLKEALVQGFLLVLKEGKIMGGGGEVSVAIAGNTVMQHLLLSWPVDGLARAPFHPYRTDGYQCRFDELFSACLVTPELLAARVTVFPCLFAFVGGDALAGAYALFRRQSHSPRMLIDLGTNGELLMWKDGKLHATSAAMGSAIEGGRFAYASDLIHLIAKARREGIMDENGLLAEPYFTDGYDGLSEEDIREFQVAKSAIVTGVLLLCNRTHQVPADIEVIYLAGGIGRFLCIEDLFVSGLFPREWRGRVQCVGNSCIGGLLAYLLDGKPPLHFEGDVMNMAEQEEFPSLFYKNMGFEAV